MIFNILNSIDLLMIRTLFVFIGIVILCRFAMAYSIRNRAYLSYPKDCRVKYKRNDRRHENYLFTMDDPWLQKIKANEMSRSPNINKDYEEITRLSYDYDYILK